MKLSKSDWIGNFLIITLGVCLLLPVYVIDGRYAQAAADKALREAKSEVRDHPERYNNTLPDQPNDRPKAEKPNGREEAMNRTFLDETPNVPNPEILYRRKVAVGNWTLWLFSLPLIGGLSTRRWAAATLIVILWLFDWQLIALRY